MNIYCYSLFHNSCSIFYHTQLQQSCIFLETHYNFRTLMWWSHFTNECVQHTVINEHWKSIIWRWSGVQWHIIHAKCCEMLKVSVGSKGVEVGWTIVTIQAIRKCLKITKYSKNRIQVNEPPECYL